eukprot:TRINITY_DN669_c2_g2_i1.p1 TRINITY_DN669_c2_g2~~TRINITY_DN669_c2_g2_i1.p1  ORF type:complete len:113 (+),score=23.55 TRINITY_DN669_c2_g2_i1:371-709(+)
MLNMQDCKLGDDGAVAFASGLSRNFVLEELDLSDNRIGDRGGNALAAALETSHLVMLNLRFNHIGGSCIARFLNVIEQDQYIKKLEFTNIHPALEGRVKLALKRNMSVFSKF